MRALACLALLVLAGCTSSETPDAPVDDIGRPGATEDAPARPDQESAAPFHLDVSGTLWLPPTTGSAPTESVVPFQLNATADVHVTLHLGSTITPVATADAVVELRDASGNVLAQAEFHPPGFEPNEQTLDVDAALAGAYELHFATYGGSDEAANGDYVDYRIQATSGSGSTRSGQRLRS